MECDGGGVNAPGAQLSQQPVGKVKTGGGGGDGTGLMGEHGLVACTILSRVAVGDIGRQRQVAMPLDGFGHRAMVRLQPDMKPCALPFQERGVEPGGDGHMSAGLYFFVTGRHGKPSVCFRRIFSGRLRKRVQKQQRHAPARCFFGP